MKKLNFFLFLIFLPLAISCKTQKLKSQKLIITTVDDKKIEIDAELARTPDERNFGFMERKNIPDGTGMLFVFEYDQQLSFWMKNTPHPLSIAYVDSRGTIREIHDMKPFSLVSVQSAISVRYALEVPQGWFEKNQITPGAKISLP